MADDGLNWGKMAGGAATVGGLAVAFVGAVADKGKILEYAGKIPMGSLSPKTKAVMAGLALTGAGVAAMVLSSRDKAEETSHGLGAIDGNGSTGISR
jgi:hypothetical protein